MSFFFLSKQGECVRPLISKYYKRARIIISRITQNERQIKEDGIHKICWIVKMEKKKAKYL